MNASNRLLRQAHRASPIVQFRALDDKQGRFQARVMHYNVVDDYRTIFAPGLFEESLQTRLPRVVWAHDWSEPLGRYIDYEDGPEYLDLIGEFDDFNDVPRARQAYAQLKSGTIDEFSVGFMPLDGEEVQIDGEHYFKFTRARLDEVSLVLTGAVPNTQLLAVRHGEIQAIRSDEPTISKDFAAQTILDLHAGTIDISDALSQIKVAAVAPADEEDPPEEDPPAEDPPAEDPPAEDPPAEDPPAEDPPAEGSTDEDPPAGDPPAEDPPAEAVEIDFSDLEDVDALIESW